MNDYRVKLKKGISVGSVKMGKTEQISVQSMTNTNTKNIDATCRQISQLAAKGCDIVRIAVPDIESANAVYGIKDKITIPLVCDIHFNYKIALRCIEAGADKIRINPGNIGSEDGVKAVADGARANGIPIRIGVNAGSLEKEILERFGKPTPRGMVMSALNHICLLEKYDFNDIVVSLKASNVPMTIEAYRLLHETCNYPLHVGVTEAGTNFSGTVKSCAGIGTLLAEGIGDTIRVSLTGDPIDEVKVGIELLKSLELKEQGVSIISCPTCGRCEIDLIGIAQKVEIALENCNKNIKVAVMGCVVNGPGEAREADIGIAGGKECCLLFKKGEIIGKYSEEEILNVLLKEISLIEKK